MYIVIVSSTRRVHMAYVDSDSTSYLLYNLPFGRWGNVTFQCHLHLFASVTSMVWLVSHTVQWHRVLLTWSLDDPGAYISDLPSCHGSRQSPCYFLVMVNFILTQVRVIWNKQLLGDAKIILEGQDNLWTGLNMHFGYENSCIFWGGVLLVSLWGAGTSKPATQHLLPCLIITVYFFEHCHGMFPMWTMLDFE